MSRPYGMVAEFDDVASLVAATRAAVAAGYTRLDAYSPFPIAELSKLLGRRTVLVPLIAVVAGLVGAVIQYGSQHWMNAIDYPINVGGRPLHSWPAFIPATIIVAVLWTAAATLIGMLALCRLPQLHHPIFEVPGFERASEDRFFLCIEASDPRYDRAAVMALLARQRPCAVREPPA